MTITNDRERTYQVNWCSAVVSPGELWISLPLVGTFAQNADDFDRVKRFTVHQDGEETIYLGYTLLTNVMLDADEKTLTIRVKQKGGSDAA